VALTLLAALGQALIVDIKLGLALSEAQNTFSMKQAPNCVLLPLLFPSDLVGIGYMLHNPLNPSNNPLPLSPDPEECTEPKLHHEYQTIASVGANHSFTATLGSLLGLGASAKHSNIIRIDAETMTYTTLKNADGTFSRICQDEATRTWINRMHQYRKKIYFVIGVQSLQGAQLRRVMLDQSNGSIEALLPLEQASLPVHAEIKASASVDGLGYVSSKVSGIFGIEVRKVNVVTREGEPTLYDNCSWRYATDKVKSAGGQVPKSISVSLGDCLEEEEFSGRILGSETEA
jgi:hypothetical protein